MVADRAAGAAVGETVAVVVADYSQSGLLTGGSDMSHNIT